MPRAAELQVVITADDKTRGALTGLGGNLKKLGTIAAGLAGAAAVGIGAVGAGIAKLAVDAAAIEPVRTTFENLSKSIGETSKTMLTDLRQATWGTLKDSELMQAGSKLVSMGLAKTKEEAGKLAKMAVTLGTAMGEKAGAALENFTLMLANQSIPRLDTFGISSGQVRERILELMGSVKGMTRESAFMQAVMELGGKAMERVGDVSGTSAVTMAQLQTIVGNLKDTVGTAFLPVLKAMLEPLRDLAVQYGPQIQVWAERFAAWLTSEGIPALQAFAAQMIAWASEMWSKIQQAWAVIQPILQMIAGWFQGEGPAAVGQFGGFFAEQIAYITSWVNENMPLIQETISTVMNAIQAVVSAVLTAVAAFWQDHGQRIMEIVSSVWEIVKAVIETALHVILGIIKVLMQVITGDWEGAWETIKDIGQELWGLIQTLIEEGKDIIVSIFEILRDTLASVWNAMWSKLKEIASDMLDKIKEMVSGFKNKMVEAGKSLIQGLIDGIKAMAQRAVDAAKSVVSDAIEAAKRLLRIGSASQVFHDFGVGMMQGLAEGMEWSSALPLDALETLLKQVAVIFERAQEWWDQFLSKSQIEEIRMFAETITSLVDALRALAEVPKVPKVNWLADFMKSVAEAVAEAYEYWDKFLKRSKLAEIREFGEMMASIGGGVESMVEGLLELGKLKSLGNLPQRLEDLLKGIARAVSEAYNYWEKFLPRERLAVIKEFAEMLIPLGRAMASAVEGLLDVATYTTVGDFHRRMEHLALDLREALTHLLPLADAFDIKKEPVKTLLDTLRQFGGAFSGAVEALVTMGAYATPGDFLRHVQAFAQDLHALLSQLVPMATRWASKVAALDAFAGVMEKLGRAVDSAVRAFIALEAFWALPTMRPIIDRFAEDIAHLFTRLKEVADLMTWLQSPTATITAPAGLAAAPVGAGLSATSVRANMAFTGMFEGASFYVGSPDDAERITAQIVERVALRVAEMLAQGGRYSLRSGGYA